MEEPKKVAASAQEAAAPQPESEEILDLTEADPEIPSLGAGPKLTVYKGFTAASTIEGGDVIKAASLAQKLPTPLAGALVLADVPGDPCALYGIPTLDVQASHLKLNWDDIAEKVRCNVRRLFTLKRIAVPKRTRMVIHLEPWQHEKYGSCVKLWWNEESFVPIVSRPRSNKNKASTESKENNESKEVTEGKEAK